MVSNTPITRGPAVFERRPAADKVIIHYPEGKRGKDLLAYAYAHDLSFGELLGLIYSISDANQAQFAAALKITEDQLATYGKDEQSIPSVQLLNHFADRLSGRDLHARLDWRKFILNIPAHVNQDMLDHCFEPKAYGDKSDRVVVNLVPTQEQAHAKEIRKFLDLVKDVKGLPTRNYLAHVIAKEYGLLPEQKTKLRRAFSQMTLGRQKELDREVAEKLAAYAFPGIERQKQRELCITLFTDPKYHVTRTEQYRRLWQSRHANAAANPPPDPVTVFPPGDDGQPLTGQALLHYAQEQQMEIGDLLMEIKTLSGFSKRVLAMQLGLNIDQCTRLLDCSKAKRKANAPHDAMKEPEVSMMDTISAHLGEIQPERNADPALKKEAYENRVRWRQFITGVYDRQITQDTLDQCFDKKTGYRVDTEAQRGNRVVALARFFKLLRQRHGFAERAQLADAIGAKAGMDQHVARQLRSHIHHVAGAEENADKETVIGGQNQYFNLGLNEEMAKMVSDFAFPDSKPLREQCMSFLQSERYRTAGDSFDRGASGGLHEGRN
jgi:hypothetical protein